MGRNGTIIQVIWSKSQVIRNMNAYCVPITMHYLSFKQMSTNTRQITPNSDKKIIRNQQQISSSRNYFLGENFSYEFQEKIRQLQFGCGKIFEFQGQLQSNQFYKYHLLAQQSEEESQQQTNGNKSETNNQEQGQQTPAESSEESNQKPAPRVVYDGEPITIGVSDLKDYVGSPPFSNEKIYEDTPPGVVMGLAWTSMGGSTLYIESAVKEKAEGKGTLQCTGQLGDVMKESSTIAHTFCRSFMLEMDAENQFFNESAIHLHIPAGATPKDGPSAGCTMITSLLSLAMKKPVRPNLAMTGEVTLTGMVLPIGGVKEKTLAAKRSGVKHIIFPKANQPDWDELSDDVRQGLEPHFVTNYKQIYDIAFGDDESESSKQ
eukprot:TRINITY_DN16212_c0_g1_i1.p1 TRINITY_DN16212_c0_g1~~TRINITY_DN16212_c0_g1_i1.p1  ORF type:complete len:397 (-),score=61.58 TRINITY_DN16212_c0_g1_i1:283-1410(-)